MFATSLLALLCAAQLTADAPRPPSVLLVITDDQRNDMLSCAGHPILETPAMDALAARGARFENAFVTTPICAASRATILASRYEASHGFTFGKDPLPKALTDESWPALLRRAGWRTGHIGKWGMRTEVQPGSFLDVFKPMTAPYWRTTQDGKRRHQTNHAGDEALAFLDALEDGDPFALTVSFNAPHAEDSNPAQYLWPDEEDGLYRDVDVPLPALASEAAWRALPPFLHTAMGRKRWGWRFDTEEKRVQMTLGYYRMIAGVDRNLRRILDRLGELGRTQDTVIVLLGDNGYFLGERGLAGKWLIYEEAIRVPMIVVDPRVREEHRGRVPEAMVLNVDVGPTILDLLGQAVPDAYQGASLAPWLAGEPGTWRSEFLVEHHMDNQLIPKHRGLRGERWVYSQFYEEEPAYEVLFDLRSDPKQLRNLAGEPEHAEVLRAMRERTAAEVRLRSGS